MAKQLIFIGASANDKTGDPIRTAFNKVNANFTELYATASADVQIPTQTNNSGKYLTTNGTALSWGTASTDRLVNGSFNFTLGIDGTVNFDPSTNGKGVLQTTADLQFIAVDKIWTFGTDGNLTLPNGSKININSDGCVDLLAGPGGYAEIGSNNSRNWMWVDNAGSYIQTSDGDFGKQWTFGTDGNLTFPDSTVQTTAYTGTSTIRSAGSVAGAGTVTINYSTDRLVRATATGSTLIIAHSNITAGKVVDLVISNTSGVSCAVTYSVPTGNTIGNTTTYAIGNGTTHVFTCRSFGTTTTDVYVTVA
jgi:hypothetical protein